MLKRTYVPRRPYQNDDVEKMTKWARLSVKIQMEDVTASKYLGDRFNGLLINRAVAGLSNGEPILIGHPFVIGG